MGKLTDLIKRAGRTEPEPMGFGASARKHLPTLLLVALAGDRWARATAEAIDAGADVLLLTGQPGDKEIEETVAAAKGHPCGLLAPDASAEQLQRLQEAGLDFALIGPSAPAAAIADEKLTLAYHLRDDLTDIQLRALDAMPFVVIYIDRDAAPTTVMRLIELQRIAGLARKPLLIQIAPESGKEELTALRDAGGALVAIDMKERNAPETLRKLRATIDGLPRRPMRRDERPNVALSRGGGAAEEEEDDED